MGEFADAVRDRLRDALAERRPDLDWTTEHYVEGTPVDVVGRTDDRFVAVELEWRRADPVNNTAKLFYYASGDSSDDVASDSSGDASEGALDGYEEIVICQVFTAYYDLVSGVSSKREVAEFVGRTAADSFERVSFHPLRLDLDPPKRGGERPDGWRVPVDEAALAVDDLL